MKSTYLIFIITSIISLNGLCQQNNQDTLNQDLIYSTVIVDSVPTFIGGYDSLYSWLKQNIEFPKEEIDGYMHETKVYASFVVEKNGSVTDVRTYTIYEKFNEEVEKALVKMPKWIPAQDENKPVRCRLRIPVIFTIEK